MKYEGFLYYLNMLYLDQCDFGIIAGSNIFFTKKSLIYVYAFLLESLTWIEGIENFEMRKSLFLL